MDRTDRTNMQMISKLMFRLLPAQVFIAVIGSVNGIVSSWFATHFIGADAMSAVGLFAPLSVLLSAVCVILTSGATVLCGKYLGQNETDRMHNVFALDLLLAFIISAAFTAALLLAGAFDLTGFFSDEQHVRRLFNQYLIGMSAGVIPFFIGSQLTAFLAMEHKEKLIFASSFLFLAANIVFNIIFVKLMGMDAVGLALASSAGMWIFLVSQAAYFICGRSQIRFRLKGIRASEGGQILSIGFPGAASNGYQTLRGLVVNKLLMVYTGSVAVSAFATANNTLGLFWAIHSGMVAVTRIVMSISAGERDRQSMADITRVALLRFVPILTAVAIAINVFAVPLTRIYYRDPSDPVFMMTAMGFRILPICLPLAVICTHYVCYGQIMGRRGIVNLLTLLDGVVFVAGASVVLVPLIGVNGVYVANVFNGVACALVIIGYARVKNGSFPKTAEELLSMPDDFGVPQEDRIDISVKSIEDVVTVAERAQGFCLEKGIDSKRAYIAALALEEMAVNIVKHGFTKDKKNHSVDIRVVYADDGLILRIKDDCVPFDPFGRMRRDSDADGLTNFGMRMIADIVDSMEYHNILGLNVLLINI